VRDWEADGIAVVKTAREAVEGFLSDREAMKLSEAMMRKYRHVGAEIKTLFGDRLVGSITPDEIRAMRKNWKLAAITAQKRMEMMKKFFSYCVDAEWLVKSPARLVRMPPAKYDPTLPFTDQEMEKILWAAESIREAHPKIPKEAPKKLKALILLMRYSGIRISDAVDRREERSVYLFLAGKTYLSSAANNLRVAVLHWSDIGCLVSTVRVGNYLPAHRATKKCEVSYFCAKSAG
jgi:integrase